MSVIERLLEHAGNDAHKSEEPERRAKPRLHEVFRGNAVGVDSTGQPADLDCLIDNISASGLHMRSEGEFLPDTELTVTVELFIEGQTGSTVETIGRVIRIETQPYGNHGLAMQFSQHRFL